MQASPANHHFYQDQTQRKWSNPTMSKQEPLKVYLQHRIQSIISKEWWDFVVNVNTMSSDHASLLYSVANLCPSFQNFLKSRDKEIAYILKKRPVIKPRIFSGTERSDVQPAAPPSVEIPPQKKSCSSELDKILSEMYPNEDVIKRKPRLSGPASKQRKTPVKKFKSAFATQNDNLNNPAANRNNSITLSSILRDMDPLPDLTTNKPSHSKHHHSTNKDSSVSKENKNVEYAVSDFDLNSNNVSMNLKKVKKVKVKKKRYFITDKCSETPVRSYLADETPELKLDLIRKYKIKKCSVNVVRLTQKEIEEATRPRPKPTPQEIIDETPCTVEEDLINNESSIIQKPVEEDNQNALVSPLTSTATSLGDQAIQKPPDDDMKEIVADICSQVVLITQQDIAEPETEDIEQHEISSKPVLKVQENVKNPTQENDKSSLIPKVALMTQQDTEKPSQQDIKKDLLTGLSSTISLVKQEVNKKPVEEDNKKSSASVMPSNAVAMTEQHIQKPMNESSQDPNISAKTELKRNSIIQKPVQDRPTVSGASLPPKTLLMGQQAIQKPPQKCEKKGIVHELPSMVAKPVSPKVHLSNQATPKASENGPINKIMYSNSSNNTPVKSSDHSANSPFISNKNHQKECGDVTDKYKPKELLKDLKTVYCHGGIVPLGKKVSSVEKPFDKNKHFLSLREKKTKDNSVEVNESTSHLKENEKNSTNGNVSNNLKTQLTEKITKSTEDSVTPSVSPGITLQVPCKENITNGNSETRVTGSSSEEIDSSDDLILVIDESENKSPEVIEIDSDDDNPVPLKVKVETMELDSSSLNIIDSSKSENKGSTTKKSVTAIFSNSVDSDEEHIQEPPNKRPRVEVNLTEMKLQLTNVLTENNTNDLVCNLCKATFTALGDWLNHHENNVPKCTPNLQVTWDSPSLPLLN